MTWAAAQEELDFDDHAFFAMLITLFYCCGRAGEISGRSDTRSYVLQKQGATFNGKGFYATLPRHKGDPCGRGTFYYFSAQDSGPAALGLLKNYVERRAELHCSTPICRADAGALFVNHLGRMPFHEWFVARLKGTFGPEYSAHSMRAGGRLGTLTTAPRQKLFSAKAAGPPRFSTNTYASTQS